MENQQQNDMDEKNSNENSLGWERDVLEKLAMAAVTEQRRTRRWSVFFKMLMFVYLLVIGVMAFYPGIEKGLVVSGEEHTAIVDVIGMIAENG